MCVRSRCQFHAVSEIKQQQQQQINEQDSVSVHFFWFDSLLLSITLLACSHVPIGLFISDIAGYPIHCVNY